MRPVTITLSGAGVSQPIPLDIYADPFAVALALKVNGTNTNSVEYTFDDPFAPGFDPATASWTAHPNLSAKTTSTDSNLAFPARAVRLNQTAHTSGSATLTVLQAGIRAGS